MARLEATEDRLKDGRQAVAARNVQAILDAAERLLARGAEPSISAVAAESGLSRPTVYSHFGDRERLIEVLVERTVQQARAALESAEPDRGPADEALRRLLAASWEELGRHEDVARAAAAHLGADAMRRAHASAREVVLGLVDRGRAEGAFRTDLSAGWLVTACLALIHAAAEEVRAGDADRGAALDSLTESVLDLIAAPAGPARPYSPTVGRAETRSGRPRR